MNLSRLSNSGSLGLETNFLNQKNNLSFNTKTNSSNSAYYAKKGEPMYMKEMDGDEDGIVSFEEFREYCDTNEISTRDRIKMADMAASYRTMQAYQKVERFLERPSENNKTAINTENNAVYAKRGDSKYDEAMDTNNDDTITYKEYIEYCKENTKPKEAHKSNTKFKKSDSGEFKTVNIEKAINSYTQSDIPEGMYNSVV